MSKQVSEKFRKILKDVESEFETQKPINMLEAVKKLRQKGLKVETEAERDSYDSFVYNLLYESKGDMIVVDKRINKKVSATAVVTTPVSNI